MCPQCTINSHNQKKITQSSRISRWIKHSHGQYVSTTCDPAPWSVWFCHSWGLPIRIPSQPQAIPETPPEPPPTSSPPDNPWQRLAPASPPGGAAASVCFSDIVQDQMHQKRSLEKASQKPLHLIQVSLLSTLRVSANLHLHWNLYFDAEFQYFYSNPYFDAESQYLSFDTNSLVHDIIVTGCHLCQNGTTPGTDIVTLAARIEWTRL